VDVSEEELLRRLLALKPSSQIERIYWNVGPTAVLGVLDQIPTKPVALVAEVRATGTDPSAPTAEM
jgi:hypothetical protein